MTERSEKFVKKWVRENVHNMPGLEDYRRHAEDLSERLKDDAYKAGIKPEELAESVGDSYDFTLNAYEQVHDPELGFKG